MTTLQKTYSFLLILATASIGCLLVSYLIKGFFLGLGWIFNNPLLGLIGSCTFLLGCFISNLNETKSN